MESRGFASLPHERFALFGLSGKGWPVRQVDLPVLAEAQAI
jgi:hypothetical protein